MKPVNSNQGSTAAALPKPGWVFRTPARVIAFGFGSGLLRPGPGTWGTAMAWVLWLIVVSRFSDAVIGFILVLSFGFGCWCCHKVGKELRKPDFGGMVWDEIVAFWLVLWLVPASFQAQLTAFILFRAFDIVKPAPIHYFDARLKNGFGVMWDDILAAGYTLLVMAVIVKLEVLL